MRHPGTEPVGANRTWIKAWLSPSRLLIAAAIFHLLVTLSIYGLGHYAILPGTFDKNGIAISFAPDGIEFQEELAESSDELRRGQIRDWFKVPTEVHLRLHSVSFALLGPLVGPNIISAEPLNVLCYLAVLVLTFQLGLQTLGRRTGLIAATVVALWPSFLLHTTQLLKDPLFLVAMLAFLIINVHLLSQSLLWTRALLTAAVGGGVAIFVWLARDSMGELMITTVVLGALILVVRQFWEKHFQAANIVAMVLFILMSVGVTRVIPKYRRPYPHQPTVGLKKDNLTSEELEPINSGARAANPLTRLASRVGTVRQRFADQYPDSTSNLDSTVMISSFADLVRYLPRAAEIGFFAPFPNMWLAQGGQVGSAGRLLSGMETFAMYWVEGLAVVGLWLAGRGRRRFAVWFLWLVAMMGMISLGLVVMNIGTLYRLRYVFSILLIIFAAEGASAILNRFQRRQSEPAGPQAEV